jgi:hypothetical protein
MAMFGDTYSNNRATITNLEALAHMPLYTQNGARHPLFITDNQSLGLVSGEGTGGDDTLDHRVLSLSWCACWIGLRLMPVRVYTLDQFWPGGAARGEMFWAGPCFRRTRSRVPMDGEWNGIYIYMKWRLPCVSRCAAELDGVWGEWMDDDLRRE